MEALKVRAQLGLNGIRDSELVARYLLLLGYSFRVVSDPVLEQLVPEVKYF